MTNLHDRVVGYLADDLANPGLSNEQRLRKTLPMLGRWRQTVIRDRLLREYRGTVLGGPFAGLVGLTEVREGCQVPKLLGSYERELRPVVERIIATSYDVVVNVGCAEGYYAVGLARRMPQTRILAFDTNPQAQAACRRLAERNGVADRVLIGGTLAGEDFARFAGRRAVVICDIEGAEDALLDPAAYPALAGMDVLVECHDCFKPGMSKLLGGRFQASHRVELFERQLLPFELPPLFDRVSDLDRMLAVWEWRAGPTPWLFMTTIASPKTDPPACR